MHNPGIKNIIHDSNLLAIIVYERFDADGVHFFTNNDLSQQLAYMRHPAGKIIAPHFHNPVDRMVSLTHEVLFIKQGKLRVDFYTTGKQYIESHILNAGDLILLASGGHGFKVLEDLIMYEVKQGPYAGEHDKTLFDPCTQKELCIKS